MALSIKRFWFLANQVDRIRGERELRQMQLMASVTAADAYKAAHEHLKAEVGQVYIWRPVAPKEIVIDPNMPDPEFDRAGFNALKAKYGRKKK